MNYTITQAAQAVGKGRSTIHRAIKEGRLSAHRGEGGTYTVDASELARVFTVEAHAPAQRDATAYHDTAAETELATLSLKVALLEVALDRERDTLAHEREATADLRRRLDRAEDRAQALTYQARDQVHGPSSPASPKGFLRRLLGRVL